MIGCESQLLFYKIPYSYFQGIIFSSPNSISFMQAKLFGLFKIYLGNHDLYLKTCSINGLKPYCEDFKNLEIVLN
jgi:hypothetical protein